MSTLNLRRFTDLDTLKAISPARVCAFFHPWREYLSGRGLDLPLDGRRFADYDRLAHLLMTPAADVPKEMIDALYYVVETSNDEDMDALIEMALERNLSLQNDLLVTPIDVAMQAWLANPDLLRDRHAESVAFRQKNFLFYGAAGGKRRPFPAVNDELRGQIQRALDDWFEQHKRGRGCKVFLFPRDDQVWILVRHGLPQKREASHQEDGRSAIEFYRPQQHDVLIYDAARAEMAVHAATKGEIKLYLTCFGSLLFGAEQFFPEDDKFTLAPLIGQGANSLLCEDVDGIKTIRLIEFRRFWGGAYQEIETRRAADIFASLSARAQTLGNAGRLIGATFKVRFTDSVKERSVVIRPPRNARYERNEDSELIESWLAKRGFILKPEGVIDDEAPTEVVEGTGRDTASDNGSSGVAPAVG